MADRYSFTDELARLNAGTRREQERAEGQENRRRFLDYRRGKSIGNSLVAKIGAAARSAEEAVRNLRHAARDQGDTLVGRVAAGELTETAQHYEREMERQQPQREADDELRARARARTEAIRAEHYERAEGVNRAWYRARKPDR